MKVLFSALLLMLGASAFGQTTITLTEDLVLTETLVITESTTYNGNGFSIICDGCDPAVYVREGAVVHFEDVRFPKTYASWLRVAGGQMRNVTWNSPRMQGFINIDPGPNE